MRPHGLCCDYAASTRESGFFFIGGTCYSDMRGTDAKDLSATVRAWAADYDMYVVAHTCARTARCVMRRTHGAFGVQPWPRSDLDLGRHQVCRHGI